MIELCCSVNTKEKCTNCSTPLCAEHLAKGRHYRDYCWCTACAEASEDYINIIEDLGEKLAEAVGEFDVVAGLVDDVHGHAARCRHCRDGTECNDLFGIIDNAGSHTSSVHRRVMRLMK